MPRRAARVCANPECPVLVEVGSSYCPEHEREVERQAREEYERNRLSAARRGYGARWRKLRVMVLRRQPLCQDPYGIHEEAGEVVPATEVDHIIPRRRGGDDSMENLQGLCKGCHSRKTAVEDGRWGR